MAVAGSREIETRRVRAGRGETAIERVVVEEPLETRLDGQPLCVTMRTPGNDLELVAGFLLAEGIVPDAAAIAAMAHCDDDQNVIEVRSDPAAGVRPPAPRGFLATSSCGVCGKASIAELHQRVPDLAADGTRVPRALLAEMPERLRGAQRLFSATGALHGAGLFDADGELLCVREDVGRHNAVDKVIGWAALSGRLPLAGHVLLVSGRSGFEIVQKALMAQIPILASISGSSSLAVELASDSAMTLIAFLRPPDMSICAAPERVPDA